MGIGGGWYQHEWEAYGYGFPSAGDRLGMLDEGVQIMRQLWTTGVATARRQALPRRRCTWASASVQAGGIPFWIAGGGEKRTLRIAAPYADYTNFSDGRADEFARKSQILADHCRDVGSDFDAITRSVNFNVVIGETATGRR